MDRIARVRRLIYATLPIKYRVRVAMVDILAGTQEAWFRRAINQTLGDEFTKAGIQYDADLDFFEIIHRAVLRRVGPTDPEYDDLFQEVAMGFLDRKSGVTKDWVQDILKMQGKGLVTNLRGWLATVAQRYVQDLHNKVVRNQGRSVSLRDPGEEEGGGVDLERHSPGATESDEAEVSAVQLYNTIQRELKDDRSKKIMRIIVEHGIKGFLRGKGLSEVAKEMGVTPSTATYYRDQIFKPDLLKALKRMGDQDLVERAKEVFAAVNHPPVALVCRDLATLCA
jgi:DNA-directed RNA polymerase specialized sigma24 family protein